MCYGRMFYGQIRFLATIHGSVNTSVSTTERRKSTTIHLNLGFDDPSSPLPKPRLHGAGRLQPVTQL